uniref:LRRNT domain-containing protein n=1 Tax=Parastrongyloides trichosuri TaxID=131310 RepID=A0A0N4ZKP1_PARTI
MNVYFLLLIVFLQTSHGSIFKCLDNCECDDGEGIIHCHKLGWTLLNLPKTPMRKFKVLRLTDNNLEYLPSEEMLKTKFPDLEGVDVEGNPKFECESLKYYRKLTVFSDCTEDGIIPTKGSTTTQSTSQVDEECDLQCEIANKARDLANYAKIYWKKFVDKLKQFDRENETWIGIKGKENETEKKFPFLKNLSKQQKDDFFNIRKNPTLSKQDVKNNENKWALGISEDVKRAYDLYVAKEDDKRVNYQKALLEASENLSDEAKDVFRRIEAAKANMDISKGEEKTIVRRILSGASSDVKKELKKKLPSQNEFYKTYNTTSDKTYGINPELVKEYLNIKRKSNKTKLEIKNEQAKFIEDLDEDTQKKFRDHLQEVELKNEAKRTKELELYKNLSSEGKEVYDKIKIIRGNDEITYREEEKQIKELFKNLPKKVKNELKAFKNIK